MLEKLSLDGKTIVVTGGGTGLGREMALACARAGANMVLAGRRTGPIEEVAEEVRRLGQRSLAVSTDVSDSSQVENLAQRTLAEFGKVDVLFNNAGHVDNVRSRPIWEITDEEWMAGIGVALSGAFYCSRAVAKQMADRGQGKIINVSSGFGVRAARDGYLYTCPKGGIMQLTRTLAFSLARYGVTCNGIIPGFFQTQATEEIQDFLPKGEFVPIGRVGRPEEIGPVAVFLASAASDYMNGEFFTTDSGGLVGGLAPTGYTLERVLEQ